MLNNKNGNMLDRKYFPNKFFATVRMSIGLLQIQIRCCKTNNSISLHGYKLIATAATTAATVTITTTTTFCILLNTHFFKEIFARR
jgi:hypothetical protein